MLDRNAAPSANTLEGAKRVLGEDRERHRGGGVIGLQQYCCNFAGLQAICGRSVRWDRMG